MKWSRSLLLFVATVAVVFLGSMTLANGLPSWWGANDGLTSNFTWTFDDQADPLKPTDPNAPFGDPVWTFSDPAPPHWMEGGHFGVGAGQEGWFDITLKNIFNPLNVKHVFLQYDLKLISGGFGWSTEPQKHENFQFSSLNLGDGWERKTYTFDFFPQPEWERFHFIIDGENAPTVIDNLMIGTHCTAVPEPFSLLLAAPALALALARRKRA